MTPLLAGPVGQHACSCHVCNCCHGQSPWQHAISQTAHAVHQRSTVHAHAVAAAVHPSIVRGPASSAETSAACRQAIGWQTGHWPNNRWRCASPSWSPSVAVYKRCSGKTRFADPDDRCARPGRPGHGSKLQRLGLKPPTRRAWPTTNTSCFCWTCSGACASHAAHDRALDAADNTLFPLTLDAGRGSKHIHHTAPSCFSSQHFQCPTNVLPSCRETKTHTAFPSWKIKPQ
jgi:hypothetical protein